MKTIKIFFLILVATASILVSCKKDRVCECKSKLTSNGVSIDGDAYKQTYIDAKKRQAKDACRSFTLEEDEDKYEVTCELK